MGSAPQVAILDYGMGNLFNIRRACEHVGLAARATAAVDEVLGAEAAILPGIGAFGDAMKALRRLGLDRAVRELAAADRPLLCICLGMQLLMDEGTEFGSHQGLGVVSGSVVRFPEAGAAAERWKVPQVGWNRLRRAGAAGDAAWRRSLLGGLSDGVFMYFSHSYHVVVRDPGAVVARTEYAGVEYCSALQRGRLFACQCHPERSGETGLQVYRNFAAAVAGGRRLPG